MSTIRIAGYVNDSLVDGPGIRFSVFTQGCPYACPFCHNAHTWDPHGGEEVEITYIIAKWRENPLLDGITLSGGEPLFQKEKLLPLIEAALSDNLSIVMYTGTTLEKLWQQNDPLTLTILSKIDYLIDGPFVNRLKDLTLLYRGSSNQRIIDMKKTTRDHIVTLTRIDEFG